MPLLGRGAAAAPSRRDSPGRARPRTPRAGSRRAPAPAPPGRSAAAVRARPSPRPQPWAAETRTGRPPPRAPPRPPPYGPATGAAEGGTVFEAAGKDVTVCWSCTADAPDAGRSCTVGDDHGAGCPATTVPPGPPEACGGHRATPRDRPEAYRPRPAPRPPPHRPSRWSARPPANRPAGPRAAPRRRRRRPHLRGGRTPWRRCVPVRSPAPGAGASSDMRCDPFLGRTVMLRPTPFPRTPGLR